MIDKDTIYRQDAKDAVDMALDTIDHVPEWVYDILLNSLDKLLSAESVKAYTKADYIMALHKEYGCTLTMAEEAHNKALEHLRSKARMKG